MEGIRTDALQQFEELLIENDKKSECILIFEAAFVKMRNELEKEKREKDMTKFQSENLSNRFEEKLLEVQEDILEFELFSDIGISALVEGIQWFRKSIETYEQKKKSQSRIDRVQLDAARLLSTVHNQIRANIQLCNFGGDEYDQFQKLAKSLEDSIHIMNSKISICSQNVVNINNNEMVENMNEVGQLADDLLIFLKNIQEHQRKTIDDKLKFNTNEEKCKLIINNAKSENAKEVEKIVGKSVEKFVKLNRNKSSLTMEDVRKIIIEVNGIWKRSYDQEVETYRNGLKIMFVEFERQLAEWNIQRSQFFVEEYSQIVVINSEEILGTKKEQNRKINEWKGSSVLIPKQLKSSEYTGIIKQTVLDITKLDQSGEYSQPVIIGGLKWKNEICVYSENKLTFYLCCEKERSEDNKDDPKWQCTTIYDFRIMDRLQTKTCHSVRQMYCFNEKNKHNNCGIELEDLIKCRKDVENDDTIHVEVEIVVLSSSGVPRIESSFENLDYQQIFGTFTHTFLNISTLDETTLESSPVNTDGLPWILMISKFVDYLKVDMKWDGGHESSLSCKATIEIRLLKKSNSDEFFSECKAKEFNKSDDSLTMYHFFPLDELMNPENDFIKNDAITIETNITIFEPIYH